MENVFFSGTFGGELLSLAAANEVIDRYIQANVTIQLFEFGEKLASELSLLLNDSQLNGALEISGHPSWSFLTWKSTSSVTADELKTYFAQLMYEEGVLILSSHNISLAHSEKLIKKALNVYSRVFGKIQDGLASGNLKDKLKVKPLLPIFKVR
jgi:glutamate-1-semialdehyde aminotransferase